MAVKYQNLCIDCAWTYNGVGCPRCGSIRKKNITPIEYCKDCKANLGDGHDCDNCSFCGTDN